MAIWLYGYVAWWHYLKDSLKHMCISAPSPHFDVSVLPQKMPQNLLEQHCLCGGRGFTQQEIFPEK